MTKRILLILGHPDPDTKRYGHVLANAYMSGAEEGGHEIRHIEVAKLDFPLLRTKEDFESGALLQAIQDSQSAIAWAEHLVVLYPLWLGTMPALLKAFFEQIFRPGFAFGETQANKMPEKLLTGKSARIVITMGMPAFIYRWYFGAHSLKSLERNILAFAGIKPVKQTLIGTVEADDDTERKKWLQKLHDLGLQGC